MKTRPRKTEALKIYEARRGSYANYPEGIFDETDLLLLQQHYGELARLKVQRKRKKAKR